MKCVFIVYGQNCLDFSGETILFVCMKCILSLFEQLFLSMIQFPSATAVKIIKSWV